jgi:hypothetical protein
VERIANDQAEPEKPKDSIGSQANG